jgi:hypothetical protein
MPERSAASEEVGGMATEPVHARTADADLFLPADGLRLLGHQQTGGHAVRRFLVSRGDGQVVQLPLLPYLILAAIAEGGVDGGWSADQVRARVGTASGQALTADTVRFLIAGKLAPLGLIAGGGADREHEAAGVARPFLARWTQLSDWLAAPLLRPGRRRPWAVGISAAAVLVCVAATAPIMAEAGGRRLDAAGRSSASLSASAPASAAQSAASASRRGAATSASRPGSTAAASSPGSAAAAWVAEQVSPGVAVGCDPGLCGQLRRDGFPAARLRPLSGGARALLGSAVVVATAAVRGQFGPRLAADYAPQVIAGFGSGAGRVDVRVVAPAGAAAFWARLAAERAALASAGRQLLGNHNISASGSARAALLAGQVDARLLTIVSLLAAQRPVRLVGFTGAPGAGAGVPLRSADIGVASTAARSAVLALLDAQQSPYRPAVATPVGGGGRATVAVWFDAPAALNISQP